MSAPRPQPTAPADTTPEDLLSLCRRLGLPDEGSREDVRAALDQLAALDPDYVTRLAASIDLRRARARQIGTA